MSRLSHAPIIYNQELVGEDSDSGGLVILKNLNAVLLFNPS